jgi:hypothetical protein
VPPTGIDAVDGETTTVVTTGVGVGAGSVVVPSAEQTTSCGRSTSHPQRPAERRTNPDLFDMRRVSVVPVLRTAIRECSATKSRRGTDWIGFAGGSAGWRFFAVAPWLCDTIFRWLCSEQRFNPTSLTHRARHGAWAVLTLYVERRSDRGVVTAPATPNQTGSTTSVCDPSENSACGDAPAVTTPLERARPRLQRGKSV